MKVDQDHNRYVFLHDSVYPNKPAELGEQLDAELQVYGPTIRAAAGAIVTLDRQGEPVIHRGLPRDVEAKALRTLARVQGGVAPEDVED